MQRVLLALWGMARPLIMLSVLLVYMLGIFIARSRGYDVDGAAVAWGCAALVLVSLSIHYANEYADFATDSLTQKTAFSGGSGVLPGGLVSPRLALIAAWVTLIAGIIVNLIAVAIGVLDLLTLPILLVGAFGGWMYSVPPLRLAYCGWGEVTNAVLGGCSCQYMVMS